MRKTIIILAAALLVVVPTVALANIAGSDHDLTGSGEKLCMACHVPHNAQGDKLWASTPSGTFTGVQDLCYTCHDGSVTSVGANTAFDAAREQHLMVGNDCSGTTGCHNVHEQNPAGSGKFLQVAATNGSYCETCHGPAIPPLYSNGHGDHTAGLTHFTNGTTFTCNQCHTAHGAAAQTANPPGLTNPILLVDNQPGAYYGEFCISCHNGTAPPVGTVGSGGQAATDVFDYAEPLNDGTEVKHPTTSTTGTTPVGGCNKCHDVHDPTNLTLTKYLLMEDNSDSQYCVSCHSAAGAPPVGGNTHFTGVPTDVNMNSGLTPALPWANQIDEDGSPGADWPTATANNMTCETCHSVHKLGFGTTPAYFLRNDNSNNEICRACHTAN